MAFTNADLLALKAELTNDPADLGLTTAVEDDEANANKLNLVRETISVRKRTVASSCLFNAIDPLEYQALSSQQQKWMDTLLSLGQFDPFIDTGTVSGLRAVFAQNSTSRPEIEALILQSGSRIEQLFQAGTVSELRSVTPSDVANARNAT